MKSKIKGIVLFLALIMAVPNISKAEGKTVIDISSKDIRVGDSFKVNIRATEAGEMEISYDSRVIKATGTDANQIGSTSHSITVSGQNVAVSFEAKAEGTSGVIVKSPSLTGSSISVKVAPKTSNTGSTSQNTQTEEIKPQEDSDEEDSLQLPQTDYIGDENGYVIPTEKEPFSKAMVKSEFNANDKTFSGYRFEGAEDGFYYFYGIDGQNAEGWYFYDTAANRFGPADVNSLSLIGAKTESKAVKEEKDKKPFKFNFTPNIFMYAAIFFVVAMIIVFIINLILKKREDSMDFTDDEDIDSVFEQIEKNEKRERKDTKSAEKIKSDSRREDSIYTGIKSDELIDELIKKASRDTDTDIINLDDL